MYTFNWGTEHLFYQIYYKTECNTHNFRTYSAAKGLIYIQQVAVEYVSVSRIKTMNAISIVKLTMIQADIRPQKWRRNMHILQVKFEEKNISNENQMKRRRLGSRAHNWTSLAHLEPKWRSSSTGSVMTGWIWACVLRVAVWINSSRELMANFWDGGGSVYKINKFDMTEVGLCPFMIILLSRKVANRKVENCDRHFCSKNW
jgi:hypothetical protein